MGNGSMLRNERRKEKLDFPFATINIILLLLFFFIVSGSILGANETGVSPPTVQKALPQRLPRPLLVVEKSGALYLDDTLVAVNDIPGRIGAGSPGAGAGDGARVLNIVADRDFSGERFLAIVEAVRAKGIGVRIVTLSDVAGG